MKHWETDHREPELRLTDDGSPLSESDVADIARSLDALAAQERASAPAGLSERVFEASRAGLGPRVVTRLGGAADGLGRLGRRASLLSPMRAAAGLALAAVVGIAVLASRHGSPPSRMPVVYAPSIETYVDAWASNADDLAVQSSVLDAETAALRESLTNGSGSMDLWAEEGAM